MLSEVQKRNVRACKNQGHFNDAFIDEVDASWEEIQKMFRNCKYDLSKIAIVPKETP